MSKVKFYIYFFLPVLVLSSGFFYANAYHSVVSVTLNVDNSVLDYNDSTVIRWHSDNAVYCDADDGANGWAGNKNPQGNFYTDNLTETTTYSITCFDSYDNGNRASASVTIYVDRNNIYYRNNNEEPNVTTYSATETDRNSAVLNAYIDTNGISSRRWFEWGTRSNSLNRRTNKSSYSGSSRNFEQSIFDLNPDTTYYFRAVAENRNGNTNYGRTLSFRTDDNINYSKDICDFGNCVPTTITVAVSNITRSGVRLSGLGFLNDSAFGTGYFEWGTTPALGMTTPQRIIGNGQPNPFYENLFGLAPGTIYYYRSVISNRYETSRGDILSFRTLNAEVYNNISVPAKNTKNQTITNDSTPEKNTGEQTGEQEAQLKALAFLVGDGFMPDNLLGWLLLILLTTLIILSIRKAYNKPKETVALNNDHH